MLIFRCIAAVALLLLIVWPASSKTLCCPAGDAGKLPSPDTADENTSQSTTSEPAGRLGWGWGAVKPVPTDQVTMLGTRG